jgi:hypothetical protein
VQEYLQFVEVQLLRDVYLEAFEDVLQRAYEERIEVAFFSHQAVGLRLCVTRLL